MASIPESKFIKRVTPEQAQRMFNLPIEQVKNLDSLADYLKEQEKNKQKDQK